MSEPVRSRGVHSGLLDATVAVLTSISGLDPPEAESAITGLCKRFPGQRIELVWHVEQFHDRPEYAVLLRDDRGVAVSVSRATGGLPWPLRGVQRWSDADVVRVNGRLVQVEEAIAFLEIDRQSSGPATRIVDACLARDELDLQPVEISVHDVQTELDRFRRERGLLSRGDMAAWLTSNGQTHATVERLVRDQLAVRLLRRRVAGSDRVVERFRATAPDYELIGFEWIAFDTPQAGNEARTSLRRRDQLLALARLAASAPHRTGELGGFAVRRRRFLDAPARMALDSRSSAVQGPFPWLSRHALIRVLRTVPGELDAEVQDQIESDLFSEWLADRRRDAKIEWAWGMGDVTRAP